LILPIIFLSYEKLRQGVLPKKNREAENRPVEPALDNTSEGRRNDFKAASPSPDERLFYFSGLLDSENNEELLM